MLLRHGHDHALFSSGLAHLMGRWLAPAALLVLLLPLPSEAASDDKEDVIHIGISTSFRPFNYRDTDGEIKGYNADVAMAICEKMKVRCEFTPLRFPEILPALEKNEIQLAASNLLWTEARAEKINFSAKYYRSTTSLVGNAADSMKDPLELLQQPIRVAAARSTTQWHYLNDHTRTQVIGVASLKEALSALRQQEADYVLVPTLFALNYLQQPENADLDFIGIPVPHPTLEGDVHLGITKARPELKKRVDAAIADMVRSGELRVLIEKYFPFNVY